MAYKEMVRHVLSISSSGTGITATVSGITADHVLINDKQFLGNDITWETQDGSIVYSGKSTGYAITDMSLYYGIPQ